MRIVALPTVPAIFVAATRVVILMPSDRDHAAATTPEAMAAHADRIGETVQLTSSRLRWKTETTRAVEGRRSAEAVDRRLP